MKTTLKGRVWKFGDNIDTDIIIPAIYLASTDPKVLGEHCMEPMPRLLEGGEGGRYYCGRVSISGAALPGSTPRSRISALGIPLVIAKSFARIFYRNAFNKGLALLEADLVDFVEQGEEIEVDIASGIIKMQEGRNPGKAYPALYDGAYR